jgi:hypothetical protein
VRRRVEIDAARNVSINHNLSSSRRCGPTARTSSAGISSFSACRLICNARGLLSRVILAVAYPRCTQHTTRLLLNVFASERFISCGLKFLGSSGAFSIMGAPSIFV